MNDLTWWLLQPSSLLLIALMLSALLARFGARRFAGRLLGLLALGWIALIAMPVEAWLASPLEQRHALPTALPPEVDGIIVLGGSVDWRASQAYGQLVLNQAGERMLAGAALAERYPAATLVLTAVTSDSLATEFRANPGATTFFFGDAYADRRAILLPEAQTTYEEAQLVLERVTPRPGEVWLLVTSALHMPRAWATFATAGLTTVAYPVDPVSVGVPWGWPDPSGAAEKLHVFDRIVREWGAVVVYRRTGRISDEVWRDPSASTIEVTTPTQVAPTSPPSPPAETGPVGVPAFEADPSSNEGADNEEGESPGVVPVAPGE